MAGSTIDHLVSLMVFLGAILLFIGLFNQTIQTAILYQRHRSIATKCSDLLDNMLLNPGTPLDWGKSGCIPTGFGIQDPEFMQYRLSSFSLMRLLSSSGDEVYYSRTGKWYSNVSWGIGGGYLLLPESECVNYSIVSKLLGTNGTYGFQLTVAPTLNVNITEVQTNPLKLKIRVEGPGFPLSGANLTYLMFWASTVDPESGVPILNSTSSSLKADYLETDSSGIAYKEFSSDPYLRVDSNRTAYTFIVKAYIGGLCGVGYKSRETITSSGNIIPFVESFENGTILLAHKFGKNDPSGNEGAVFFSSAFYSLPDNFSPILCEIQNSSGFVNFGQGKPYQRITIPTSNPGFLVVGYRKGNQFGMVVMPWGIGAIGVSVVFGDNPRSADWVATDIRQVLVNNIAYQAKLALWSLEGYQVIS
jgi:hypothetical protein